MDKELFDGDGFLAAPASWNEDLARHIAEEDGVGLLSDEHWAIIHFLRENYLTGGLPAVSHVCHVNHFEQRCIPHLFQSVRSAWRIAGLPNPGEEAMAYM